MDRRDGTGNHLPPLPDDGRGDGGRGLDLPDFTDPAFNRTDDTPSYRTREFDSLFMILPSSLHPHGCNCEHCDARRSINNFNQSSVENVLQQPSFPRQNDIDVNVVGSQQGVDMTLRRRGKRRKSDSGNVGPAAMSSPGLNSGQGLELATQSESINSGLPNRARPQCHTIKLAKRFTLQLLPFTAGQDIFAIIKGFTQTKKMCMVALSASGALSKLLHHEGEFKILTISGTFIPGEEGAADMKRANLAVSACSVDGGVVGGSVEGEGELIAGDTFEVTLSGFS